MHGVMRQEIIFAKHCQGSGRPQNWLSVPLVLTSHTWENGKNEQSHQDPVMAEAMMGEAADVSRVMFVPDYNTASVVMRGVYQRHGQFWTLVVPKASAIADLFSQEEAERLLEQGVLRLDWASHKLESQQVILTAVGAYQLEEVLKASARLAQRDVPHSVVYLLEPARFREPHSEGEREHTAPQELRAQIYPDSVPSRIFVTHTRPATLLGVLQTLNTGWNKTSGLGYINQGGTLDVNGLLFINRCAWAHILLETARVLGMPREDLLTAEELAALEGKAAPELVLV
jgi:phosphoketolase